MSNNAFQREDESTLKISDLWNLVWNRKWWYVLSLGICLLGAAFYLYRTPASYSRTAKLIVDESSQDATMRNLGVASANMMRTRMSFNTVENEMEAFKSPDLMQVVVERLGLQTRYVEKLLLCSWFLIILSQVSLLSLPVLVTKRCHCQNSSWDKINLMT